MSSPDAAIVVTALRKTYGTVEAVKGISFTVREGTTTALPGGNGAGKTTTLSMLLGGLTPTAGQITVLGEDMPRNLGNLFVSPLTLPEFIAGQLVMSVLRTLIGVGGARHARTVPTHGTTPGHLAG